MRWRRRNKDPEPRSKENAPLLAGRFGFGDDDQTLTSGTFGTEPRPPGGVPPPFGPGGVGLRGDARRLARLLRGSGSFSCLGVTGPSGYATPSLSRPVYSPFPTPTRTCPPVLRRPNN